MGQEEADTLESTSSNQTSSGSSSNTQFCPSQTQVRSKMEEMQKRIDELKEKVKYEGDLLTKEEQSINLDILDRKEGSSTELKKFDSCSYEDRSTSDTSLYFSASNFSFSSISSETVDSHQENFSKFVNNFVRNQNYKERLSLLQLHSSKQISLNVMRSSLTDLDARCARELDVIEKSLQHLEKIEAEINRSCSSDENYEDAKDHHVTSGNNRKSRTEEFLLNSFETGTPSSEDLKSEFSDENKQIRKSKTTSFLWRPLERRSKFEMDWKKNPAFEKPGIKEIME